VWCKRKYSRVELDFYKKLKDNSTFLMCVGHMMRAQHAEPMSVESVEFPKEATSVDQEAEGQEEGGREVI
jgi:hypothetical protein